MLRTNSCLLIGTVIAVTAISAVSGCGGEEFGTVDPGMGLDGSPDGTTPSNDRNSSGGRGGSGGSTGAGGKGGASGRGGGDSGVNDRSDDADDAPGTHDATGGGGGNDGRSEDALDAAPRSDADAGRAGDAADSLTVDGPPLVDVAIFTDAKDAVSDGRSDSTDRFDGGGGSADIVCNEPITYYRDEDGDGFGKYSEFVLSCTWPGDKWTSIGGDCRDDLPNVKPYTAGSPDPPLYSGTGYADSSKPQGVFFDYDCSSAEEADPTNPYGSDPDCAGLLDCKGVGYLPVNPGRTGAGIDPRCGSTTLRRCNGNILNCNFLPPETTTDPYRCR